MIGMNITYLRMTAPMKRGLKPTPSIKSDSSNES